MSLGYVLCNRACKWQRKDGERLLERAKDERVEERIKRRKYQLNKTTKQIPGAETKLVEQTEKKLNITDLSCVLIIQRTFTCMRQEMDIQERDPSTG